MDLQAAPKVELHLHLDCSLSYQVVSRLEPSTTPAEFERDFILPPKVTDLADFLRRTVRPLALLQTTEALRLVTLDLLEQLRRDNLLYAEMRFAPLLHSQRGLAPEQVVETVVAAMQEGSRATGVEARLLLCTLRHFSAEQSLQTVKLVERYQREGVVALDLASDEAGFPLTAHLPAYRYAIERGLGRIAHAGEALGSDSVWETLRELHPSRIGHGVRSIEDPALLDHLKQTGIHLEVCPQSNVQIDLYETYADHPADRLYRAGVRMNINTDTRTMTNTTLSEEYERMREVFGWGREQFLATNLNALRAAFLPEETRQPLEERVRAGYAVA